MTATITATNGAGTTSPLTVLSPFETSSVSRNVVHPLIGGGLVVSLVAPMPRSGSFEALYATEAEAFACAALHEHETSFALDESDRPHIAMTYVLDGSGVSVRLDEDTLDLWVVTVAYQAVIA
jgi:hypothetical protein